MSLPGCPERISEEAPGGTLKRFWLGQAFCVEVAVTGKIGFYSNDLCNSYGRR